VTGVGCPSVTGVPFNKWSPDRDRSEVIMASRWEEKDALRECMKSGDHRKSPDRINPLSRRAVTPERLAILHTYEVTVQ
jgi:hypothetical protein